MELRGRVALVTGAGRRVGRAIAVGLGARGMRVAVHYHGSPTDAEESVRLIRAAGGEAEPLRADLGDPGAPGPLIDAVVGRFGTLDVLVNSAAIMERTPFGQVTAGQWERIFALNLRAPFFLAQAAAPHLAGGAGGAIVNIADLAAFETWPGYLPHGLSKLGVVRLTESLARIMAPAVRVNAVAPGNVLLPDGWSDADAERLRSTTPLARNGSPADVVQAVAYLLEADFVTGETIVVDGGRRVRG
ncbi:MAG TPA: SDR family oxidoreductase [Gemmatimonadaceae bacterium]|nr:SDR family oxidoreductase [Gemmatimonadaceae bacterium]